MRYLLFSTILLIVSCSTPTDSGSLTLEGTLTVQGEPLGDALVQIDDNLNWRTTSDADGYFNIRGISKGEHTFRASKIEANDQLVGIESQLELNAQTTNLGEIRLPIPPFMYAIDTLKVTSDSVPLIWSKSSDSEFREYKVYRRDNPGLDETTGELVFVSTSSEDTSFVDDPPKDAVQYYYRVYVLSAFGKLGGSNLVNTLVPAVNLIRNPSFEESSDGSRPDIWKEDIWYCPPCGGYITDIILDNEAQHGLFSGKIVFNGSIFPEDYPDGELSLNQQIDKNKFESGESYELSLWLKTSNLRVWIALVKDYNNWQTIVTLPEFNWVDKNTEWTKYSITFTPDANDIEENPWLGVYIDFQNSDSLGYAWLDDVKLQKVLR